MSSPGPVRGAGNFAECRRRYYFDYYFSWSGWNATADAGRRQAYLLKKMTRMPMLAGDLVHQAIARYYGARDAGAQWPEVEARALGPSMSCGRATALRVTASGRCGRPS